MPEPIPAPIHVLVVDDEPDLELLIRHKFRRQVREGRLALTFAGDGVEALAAVEADPQIELVLSDINMPRMDGLTLLGKLRELDRALKVVIVSAYGDMANIRTAMNRGAFDFVTKPINFEDLALIVNKAHEELDKLRQADMLRRQLNVIQRELEIASRIQLSMLPAATPAFPEREDFDLHATMLPAQEVGGDFYDCFLIDPNPGDEADDTPPRLGFVVGDVSGKGVGAALFMAITRTMLRATALQGLPPHEVVRHANRVLHPESMKHMFVTLVYGVLDLTTGEVAFTNAGHHHPVVLRHDGSQETCPCARGLGLCLTSDFAYASNRVTLAPGDTLLLYTDGLTEAVDTSGTQFEEMRLAESLGTLPDRSPAEVIRHLLRAVESFSHGAPQADDLTLLAVQYLAPRA
ncbi:MAG: SpoIIE family protein phosphatase [Bacteroidota bacterium]